MQRSSDDRQDQYINFDVNCRDGNDDAHRLQRLYYMREGTPLECMRVGYNVGQAHVGTTQHFYQSQPALVSEPWKHPLVIARLDDIYELDVDTLFESFAQEEQDLKQTDLDVRLLTRLEAFALSSALTVNFFFHERRNLLDHDPSLETTVTFSQSDLYRQFVSLINKGCCLFLVPSITKHLGIEQPVSWLLVEVNFGKKKIIFYHNHTNNLDHYAYILWHLFVLPAQDPLWQVNVFVLPEESPRIATLFAIAYIRLLNISLTHDLFLMDHFVAKMQHKATNFKQTRV